MTAPCIGEIGPLRDRLREVRAAGGTIGLVPTMGALHQGHLSLIARAHQDCSFVVVSIFVNPTQFGPNEDFAVYPRDLQRDLELCTEAGAHLVFAPSAEEMYPPGFCTWVQVERLSEGLCGRFRPGHFRGVCTVVMKLLNICQPERAYFGEKDAQQLAVVKRMARDLDLPVEIVPCPTVREPDGLAMSSRNVRLTPEQRKQAPLLYKGLLRAQALVKEGVRETGCLKDAVLEILKEATLGSLEYLEIVNAEDLVPVAEVRGECLIALAVRFGDVRLIDNLRVRA